MGPVRVADELQARSDAEREAARLRDLELVEAVIVVDEKWVADHPDPPPQVAMLVRARARSRWPRAIVVCG